MLWFWYRAPAQSAQALTPGLFSNASTFYAPTVTPGAVALLPGLYADADTFFAATVTPGAVTLTPAFYLDADVFYAASVSGGAAASTSGSFSPTSSCAPSPTKSPKILSWCLKSPPFFT